MHKIVLKFMAEVQEKVREKGIKLKINNEVINWLIQRGFDKKMGARPLQRVIDKEVKRPLAKMLLFGDLKNSGVLNLTVEDDQLTFKPKTKQKAIKDEILEES
jgi:ATP-dependent Clp protease ATP-binding subunit ClpA